MKTNKAKKIRKVLNDSDLKVVGEGKFEKVSDEEAKADHQKLVLDNRIIEIMQSGFNLRKTWYAISFHDSKINFRCEQLGLDVKDGRLVEVSAPNILEQFNGTTIPKDMLRAQLDIDLVDLTENYKALEKLKARFKESYGFTDEEVSAVITGNFDWSDWETKEFAKSQSSNLEK